MNTDVLIIGGGPAGLSAAIELGERNLDVTIVDEFYQLGGQLRQQTQVLTSLPSHFQPIRGFELAEKLVERVNQLPIRKLLKHRVIGLYKDGSIGVTDEENVFPINAKKILVATGAYEKTIPFLKWTLPGIMTIGAAQILINRDLVSPGKETVIVGLSDFSLDVAMQLQHVGIQVKAILKPNGQTITCNQGKYNEVLSAGIPIYKNVEILEAKGNGKVEEIIINHDSQQRSFNVDFVGIDGGRSPILDIFYQLECSFGYNEDLGGWVPQYNSNLRTSNQDVFLAGNASGISPSGVLILTGQVAAISIAEELKAISKGEAETFQNSYWKEIEEIEKKASPMIWKARKEHIEDFLQPMIKDQFIS